MLRGKPFSLLDRRRIFFTIAYWRGYTPWDTGIPPPELVAVIEDEHARPPGRALDLGCGTGTNSLYLARHGWEAWGVDFAARAIKRAQRKARGTGLKVHFLQGDVTRLERLPLPERFDLFSIWVASMAFPLSSGATMPVGWRGWPRPARCFSSTPSRRVACAGDRWA